MTRIGFSHAAGAYPSRSDFLQYGVAQGCAVNAKMKACKLFLTPSYLTDYPGQSWGGPHSTLTNLAQDASFVSVFGNPQIERFYLAAFTFANGVNNPWSANDNPGQAGADLDAEYTELRALAEHLLATYPGKSFVLENLEGDWAMMRGTDPTVTVNPYVPSHAAAFFARRQKAIVDARAAVTSSAEVLNCVEINRVSDRHTARFHRDVLPIVAPDVVALSLYEAINDWIDLSLSQSELEASIAANFARVVLDVRAWNPGARVVLTDWGWPETDPNFASHSYNVGALVDVVLASCAALGIEDAVYWQVFDNTPVYRQQSLYTLASGGTVFTAAGSHFSTL